MTPTDRIDETLDLLSPDDLDDALRLIGIWHAAGHIRLSEAEEWRRRILVLQRFRRMDEDLLAAV